MPDANTFERLFLDHLPLIDRVCVILARRQGLDSEESADLCGWVRLRLVENEYRVLREFRGASAVNTYLTVVITRLARDYAVQRSGRWRPSSAALRTGVAAVRLETLVYRKQHTFDEALQIMRTSGETELSDRELTAIFASLPRREPMRPTPAGDVPLASISGRASADRAVSEQEVDAARQQISSLLRRWIKELPIEERLMLQMRFWQSMSVADIARALRVDQKPLYRKLERLLEGLRVELAKHGITAAQVSEFFEEHAA